MVCTCCDLVKGDGLGRPATQSHAHSLKQLLLGEQVLVTRKDLGESQGCVGPRGDGHLTDTRRREPSVSGEDEPRTRRRHVAGDERLGRTGARYLHDCLRVLKEPPDQCVSGFVESHHPLLLFREDLALLCTS